MWILDGLGVNGFIGHDLPEKWIEMNSVLLPPKCDHRPIGAP
jgi:hypothetical protein